MDKANSGQFAVDLSECDREPIRVPGSIQPHGFLVALSAPDGNIAQLSDNVSGILGKAATDLLGRPLSDAIGDGPASLLLAGLQEKHESGSNRYLGVVALHGDRWYDVLTHEKDGLTIIEFEPVGRKSAADFSLLYPLLNNFLSRMNDASSIAAMSQLACAEVRRVTGFGRVLVYQFDHDGHGHVIAEALGEGYHSYLHQRFPASDIPRQARELYLSSRLRLIPNARYTPSRLVPERNPHTGEPTDLAFSALRSVSPIHLQYMCNMGTHASMSISLVVKGKLWGLISCHNTDPCFVPFEVRAACEQLAQILSLRIESKEESDEYNARLELRHVLVALLSRLTQNMDFRESMAAAAPDLLRLVNASGAALLFEDQLHRYGDAPDEQDIRRLIDWLGTNEHGDVFHSDMLRSVYPDGAAISSNASGVLAVPISRLHNHYLVWFRPEVIYTVDWAGNPHLKESQEAAGMPLTPRTSFEIWRETVRGTSRRWRSSEVETALEFRSALLEIVLERAEAMADLAEELGRANKELEAFSYSVSHDLRAPLRHIVGFSDLLLQFEDEDASPRRVRFVKNIQDAARFAGKLVDDLLSFSQMGRASLRPCQVDMNELVSSCKEKLELEIEGRSLRWNIAPLPVIHADPNFLQLAVYNLLSNAVKYTQPKADALIEISSEQDAQEYVFHFRDNGVGFDMRYVHKLFGVFQRLHRMEDFPGTGIGLANVRRIVERHGGRVWAEGVIDQGARISFAIPRQVNVEQVVTC